MAMITSLIDLSVLLVEPSSMQAHLVQRMLANQGVKKVTVVETASAALAALHARHDGTVVVSSLYLPDLAGTELVAAMRAEAALETVPFILVSSETRPQVLEPV
ncbi:MAG: response regulator, partial [Dechloromonas sp.]|nr:response regulator [Dechloromonas sp.]